MFISHKAINTVLTVIIDTFFTEGYLIGIGIDQLVKLDDLLLLIIHF